MKVESRALVRVDGALGVCRDRVPDKRWSLQAKFDALDRLGGMVPARHLEYEVVPAHEACLVLGRVEGVEVGLRPSRCAVQAGSAWPVSA